MSMDVFSDFTPRQKFVWLVSAVKWADEVGPEIRSKLKEEAPVGEGPRRGRLRDSIRYERRTHAPDVDMYFNAHTPYAKYVIDGTRAHEIYPKAARYLHFFQNVGGISVERFVGPRGSAARSAHVNHPGTTANKFNVRAMEAMRPKIERRFTEIMREAMGGE